MDAISAVVVDDSHFMRTVIEGLLEDGGIDVVATAKDGADAVDVVAEHEPDVVTMDVQMPVMDGLEASERIMAATPTPILMLSAHTDANADVTFTALEKGAVDFFTKPGGEVSAAMPSLESQLLEKVNAVANADLVDGASKPIRDVEPAVDHEYVENATVVIASSTGGPRVVETVLGRLPLEADLRVLVVQHMPSEFTARFADRLDERSDYAVREARHGDRVGPGEAVVAKADYHMAVSNYASGRLRVRLNEDPPVHRVRPAADVTMKTAAAVIDDPLVGVVLTGMGGDGAAGIEAIKRAGGTTIAQDEATSTVFGMPKQAIETGAVDTVLPIDDVPAGIAAAVALGGSRA